MVFRGIGIRPLSLDVSGLADPIVDPAVACEAAEFFFFAFSDHFDCSVREIADETCDFVLTGYIADSGAIENALHAAGNYQVDSFHEEDKGRSYFNPFARNTA